MRLFEGRIKIEKSALLLSLFSTHFDAKMISLLHSYKMLNITMYDTIENNFTEIWANYVYFYGPIK